MRRLTLAAVAGLSAAAATATLWRISGTGTGGVVPVAAAADGPATATATATATAGEYDKPIPQDAEKREALDRAVIRWSRRTIADPYEKVGKKDPRWDDKVRALMELAVPKFSGPLGLAVTDDQVFAAARDAVDAGCDDPMVLYLYARTSIGDNYPGGEEYERRLSAGAAALEKSQYPPIRRASALVKAAWRKAGHKDDPAALAEAARMTDAGLALLPESVEADGTGPEASDLWYGVAQEALGIQKVLAGGSKAAFDRVDAALAKAPAARPVRLQFRSWFLNDYAWEARGNGFAPSVTEDGARQFAARLAESRQALEEAWALRPGDARTARLMLVVELGIGEGDRDRMESWFRRAMEADADNVLACKAKLDWLEPKWYGSFEAMMAFARACRDTRNWRSKIPLLLPEAHHRMLCYLDEEGQTNYFKTPEVWDDIRGVYTEYLKRFPHDAYARSQYAGYSYLCGRRDVAHEQFEALGEHLVGTPEFPEDWLKQARQACAASARPAAPAAKSAAPD